MAKPNNPNAALPKGHAERAQFPKLIAKNPNYFGNFPEVKLPRVFQLANDTNFEELTCVGYNPAQGLLEAVVQIKQSSGYSGSDCTPGSFEYIRFFVDTGTGFVDAGLAAINVHDLPDDNDCAEQSEKPLSYSASIAYNPPNSEDCDDPVLPAVHAILSCHGSRSRPRTIRILIPCGEIIWIATSSSSPFERTLRGLGDGRVAAGACGRAQPVSRFLLLCRISKALVPRPCRGLRT